MKRVWFVSFILFLGMQLHSQVSLSKWEYIDRLKGMWLGSCIGNWTGLSTEGKYVQPPFLTDEDWLLKKGREKFNGGVLDYSFYDPWLADDDTDIEYTYLHIINVFGRPELTAQEIATGWKQHINRYIWISNETSRKLMGRGVLPPATSRGAANKNAWMIDAQLTTEFFGAICPGMPAKALEISYLPVRATAAGYTVHAAQFFILLYSLAPIADKKLSDTEKINWMIQEASSYIPPSSKTADIIRFVTDAYKANPDKENWEVTRDLLYSRYQSEAGKHGFRYQEWYESSINFGSCLVALLYGGGDFRKTIRIGTLSGWDSDNGTSTLGGLLGLLYGYGKLLTIFPDKAISEDYDISRTRDWMPDYSPDKPLSKDHFTRMALSMVPHISQMVTTCGGTIQDNYLWKIPAKPATDLSLNPLYKEMTRSANSLTRMEGNHVLCEESGHGDHPELLCDGRETDARGGEISDLDFMIYNTQRKIESFTLSLQYPKEYLVKELVLMEGDHTPDGGWMEQAVIECRTGKNWIRPVYTLPDSFNTNIPFQQLRFILDKPIKVSGIRISGKAGGTQKYISLCEFDAVVVGEETNFGWQTYVEKP